jgi:hypothetical protein
MDDEKVKWYASSIFETIKHIDRIYNGSASQDEELDRIATFFSEHSQIMDEVEKKISRTSGKEGQRIFDLIQGIVDKRIFDEARAASSGASGPAFATATPDSRSKTGKVRGSLSRSNRMYLDNIIPVSPLRKLAEEGKKTTLSRKLAERRAAQSSRLSGLHNLANTATAEALKRMNSNKNENNTEMRNAVDGIMELKKFANNSTNVFLNDLDNISNNSDKVVSEVDDTIESKKFTECESWTEKIKCCRACKGIPFEDKEYILGLLDTYHDFLKGKRGFAPTGVTIANRLMVLLYYTINDLIINNIIPADNDIRILFNKYLIELLKLISNPNIEYSVKDFKKIINTITTFLEDGISTFKLDGEKNVIKIHDLENTAMYNFACIPKPLIQKSATRAGYKTMISNMFKDVIFYDYTPSHIINIICDNGPRNFGAAGSYDGSRLRQIITQCTIGDSANTSTISVGDRLLAGEGGDPTIYYFVCNDEYIGDDNAGNPVYRNFLSSSNIFTDPEGYRIKYTNGRFISDRFISFSSNSTNAINLNITVPDDGEYTFSFGGSSQGPSASLLATYYYYSKLIQLDKDDNYKEVLASTSNNTYFTMTNIDNILKKLDTYITDKCSRVLQLKYINDDGTETQLCKIDTINPALFLDIKRGGDSDQIMTATLIKARTNPETEKIIFCTGDILCAAIAVLNGLATVYQTSSGIQYWPEGVINCTRPSSNEGAGGAGARAFSGGNTQNIKESTPIVNDNGYYNIVNFIGNIAAIAVNALRSKISSLYPEMCKLCSMYILKNQIKIFYKTTPKATIEKYRKIKNMKYSINFSVESAMKSFRQLNNNNDIVTLKDILSNNPDTIINILEDKIKEFEGTIKIKYNSPEVKNIILNEPEFYKNIIIYIRDIIERDWDSNPEFIKTMSVSANKKLYTYFKKLIYADISKTQGRNSYSNLVVALALFNDFIGNNVLTGISVVSKLIYGSSSVKYKWVPFSQKSLPKYLLLFKNIYDNYNTSADFMNVIPASLSIVPQVSTNRLKANQQTVKKSQQNTNQRVKNISTRKANSLVNTLRSQFRQLVSGGKRRTHKTHKRHRKHVRKLHTRRRLKRDRK